MNIDNEKEFPLIPKEFWEQPKEKIRIQNIVIADGGAGQNFILKLICDSLDLPLFVEKWEFNEYNVGYPSGKSGCVFAWVTVPFAMWFNNSGKPVTYESVKAATENFKKDLRWNQPWIKTHATPVQMFELFDVEYDNMIMINQNCCSWFFRLLAILKQRCQNNMIDGRQFRIKHILTSFKGHLEKNPNSDLLHLEYISKEVSRTPVFDRFFKNNSPLSWDAAMMAEKHGVTAVEGAEKIVHKYIRDSVDKENTPRQTKTNAINKHFLEEHPDVWHFNYDEFFFDLNFKGCPAFAKTSKEEVRLYSLSNIDMVRDFISLVDGYEMLLDQLDEWEERCWNA